MTPITLQGLVVQFSACYDLPYSRVEILRKILMTICLKRKEKRDLHRFQYRYMCIKGAIDALACSCLSRTMQVFFFFFGYIEKDRASRMIYYN